MATLKQSYASRRNPLFIVKVDYDFARDGGAVGDKILGGHLPNGTVVLGGYLRVTTAFTSGGAGTAALKVEGAGDIQAAAAVATAPWSSTGFKDVVPDNTGSTVVVTTATRNIVLTIGTAALTAGKCEVFLLCALA